MKVDLFEIIFDPQEIYSRLSFTSSEENPENESTRLVELKEIVHSMNFRRMMKELWEVEMMEAKKQVKSGPDLLLVGKKVLDDLITDWYELWKEGKICSDGYSC